MFLWSACYFIWGTWLKFWATWLWMTWISGDLTSYPVKRDEPTLFFSTPTFIIHEPVIGNWSKVFEVCIFLAKCVTIDDVQQLFLCSRLRLGFGFLSIYPSIYQQCQKCVCLPCLMVWGNPPQAWKQCWASVFKMGRSMNQRMTNQCQNCSKQC